MIEIVISSNAADVVTGAIIAVIALVAIAAVLSSNEQTKRNDTDNY